MLVTLLFECSFAQLTKNNWLIGGSVAYTRYDSKGDDAIVNKGSLFDANANSGYFLTDKLACGIRANAYFAKSKHPQIDGTKNVHLTSNIGLGPFVRYYYLPVANRVNLFSDASLLYSLHTDKSTGRRKQASDSWFSSLGVGTVVFLNTSLGLEFLLAYNHYDEIDVDYKTNQLQFRIGLQFHLERD